VQAAEAALRPKVPEDWLDPQKLPTHLNIFFYKKKTNNMKHSRRTFNSLNLLACAFAANALAFGSVVLADTYPSRSIKVIVPYAPGGGADSFARLSAPELEKILGTQLIIENLAGANSAIGAQAMARAKPDGYTLMFTTDSTAVANSLLYKNLSYKPEDLVSIGTLNEVALGIVVADSLPIKTFKELVEYTKTYKGNLAYGSYGLGSQAHMMGEAYNKLTGSTLVHVPYKGAAPAVTDVMAGQVLFTFPALITVRGNIQAQKLRMLAVTSSARLPSLPDVPTFKELGYEKMSVGAWYGYFAPKDTPVAVVKKFNAALATVLQEKSFVDKLIERGAIPLISTPEQMGALIEKEKKFTAEVLALTQIKVDE
jgi:tripartite-type tricarboxylate transporter receptor subunit TctC